jgi:hypothetical protein
MSKYDDLVTQAKRAKETMPKDILFKANKVSVRYRVDCDDFVVTTRYGDGISDTKDFYMESNDMKKVFIFLMDLFGQVSTKDMFYDFINLSPIIRERLLQKHDLPSTNSTGKEHTDILDVILEKINKNDIREIFWNDVQSAKEKKA